MIDIMVLRQSYKRREIDEIRWICGKDNLADVMTKASSNLVLKKIIAMNKATIRLKKWIK